MSSHETDPTKLPFEVSIRDINDFEKLLEMKQDNFFRYKKPRLFTIGWTGLDKIDWNHELFGALIELLFHFHENGIIWEELVIWNDEAIERFIRPLLHAINTMKIFKKMEFTARVDGIEAKGLDEELELIVDRVPRIGIPARSTPELILKRLEARSVGTKSKVFKSILDRL